MIDEAIGIERLIKVDSGPRRILEDIISIFLVPRQNLWVFRKLPLPPGRGRG